MKTTMMATTMTTADSGQQRNDSNSGAVVARAPTMMIQWHVTLTTMILTVPRLLVCNSSMHCVALLTPLYSLIQGRACMQS